MSKLPVVPSTWMITELGKVVEYGKTIKVEPNQIEPTAWILELEDIEKNTSKLLAKLRFADRDSKSTKNQFEVGDILYGKLRPYLNKVLIADDAGYCSTEIVPLKPGDYLDNRFLFYWLKHPAFLDYVEAESHGLNMPRLGTETGRAAPFVLAPLNEQKRIADKLDAVLARVDASLGRLDRIPAILKRFRQSALSAATQGALTEDWRFANELKEPESAVLGENCDVLGGKRLPKGFELTDQNTGFPYVRVTDFATFSVKTEQLKYVPIEAVTTIKKYIISSGDIYISIAGSIGSVGQVPETISGSNLTENAARIIVRDGFLSKYLMYQLASPELQAQMHAKKIATTQDKLGLFRIKELELIKPSFEEQTEIVRRLESLFAYADRLEARYNTARTQVEKLTPALLAKAFRGELIPQDPNDEPASELLARIAAGKTAEQAKTRAGKRQIKPS